VHTAVGKGLYTVPEASRYTKLPRSTVRRCLAGYEYASAGGRRRRARPQFAGDFARTVEGRTLVEAVSFRDLIELRFVAAFRERGVAGQEIRLAAASLARTLQTAHPFCSRKFRTLAGRILLDIEDAEGIPHVIELARDQRVMREIVRPFAEDVHFDDNDPVLWRPSEGCGRVVLDPARSFGRPLVEQGAVPTVTLYRAWNAEGKRAAAAARWYGVTPEDVEAAVAFEEHFGGRPARVA
jgi:uncharacterized protein (DUF433 family)